MVLFAALRVPGRAGTMNSLIGARLAYVTGYMIMPLNQYMILSSLHRMDTVFAFSCSTMFWSATNVGSPLIWVRY